MALARPRLVMEWLESRDTPATFTWDGGGGDNNWNTPMNWAADVAPATDGTADLVFPTGPVKLTATNNFVGASFNSIAFTGSGYLLNGTALTLPAGPAAGAIQAAMGTTGNDISLPVTLGAASAATQSVAVDATAVLSISGAFTSTNAPTLAKSGTGTLVLSADNSLFTGPISVTAGVLRAQGSANALGTAAAGTAVAAGAQLQVQNIAFIAEPLVLNGSGPAADGALLDITTGVTFTGGVTLASNAAIGAASNVTLTLNGAVGGPGNLTKVGAGTLTFGGGGANSYGTTTVTDGFFQPNKPANTVAVPAALTVSGSGTVRLLSSNQIADTAAVRVTNGRTFNLNNFDETIGALTLGGPNGSDAAFVTTGTGTLKLTGDITREFGATVGDALITGRLDLNGATRTVAVPDGPMNLDLSITAVILDSVGGAGLTKTGDGLLQFAGSAANTYTGTTTVAAGTLNLSAGAVAIPGPLVVGTGAAPAVVQSFAANQIADASPVTVNAAGSFNLNSQAETTGPLTVAGGTVNLPSGSALTPTGTVTLTAATILGGGTGRLILTGDVVVNAASMSTSLSAGVDLNGATRTLTVADGSIADDLVIQGTITGGSAGLVKAGPGMLRLIGDNTYTGPTTLTAGTLRIDGQQPGSPVTVSGGTLAGQGKVGAITTSGGVVAPGQLTTPTPFAATGLALAGATFAPVLVGNTADLLTVTGPVNLTGGTLSATRIGALPTIFRYTLIANAGGNPVVGTFAGLPEGAAVSVGGTPFTITYRGNGANDVVLVPTSGGGGTDPGPAVPGSAPLAVGGPADGTARVYAPGGGGIYHATPASLAPFGTVAADVRVAVADVNGDKVPDTILVTGPGTPVRVAVVSGADNTTLLVSPFDPFEGFTGGAFVSAGDFDGDGRAEFVVTPDRGGGPRVSVYSLVGNALTRRANFFTVDADFRGGARAAVGDVNKDGTPDLAVAAGFGGGPRVALIDGKKALTTDGFAAADRLVGDFFVFPDALRNGVYVAIGDVDGDGYGDLVFGAGPGGGPQVLTVSGAKLLSQGAVAAIAAPLSNFFVAGTDSDRGGVRVAVANADNDGRADVAVGTGEGRPSRVRVYLGKNFGGAEPAAFQDLDPFAATLADGVFVG